MDNYNPLDELGSEVERAFTFENGDYLYVDYDAKNNILYAGHATNAGIEKEVEVQYDKDDTLYANLEKLYYACIEDDPERLGNDETTDSKKTMDNYNPLDELGSEVERAFTFENGDYLYVDYDEKENILFAGHATNAGIEKEVEVQYDKDDTLYANLEKLYYACIEDDPERLGNDETTDSKKTEVVMDTKKCDGKTNGNYTFKLSKKKNEYGEYEIRCYKDGKRYPNGDYFTEDWDDAVGTIKDIAKRQGLNFNQKGSIYVADSLRRKTKDWGYEHDDSDATFYYSGYGYEDCLDCLYSLLTKDWGIKISKKELRELVEKYDFDEIYTSELMSKFESEVVGNALLAEFWTCLKKLETQGNKHWRVGGDDSDGYFLNNEVFDSKPKRAKLKKTKDTDFSYDYELIDVEYYPNTLKQTGNKTQGTLDKSITGVCNFYGIETRKGKKYEDNVLAKFTWYVPENEVHISVYSNRTMPYANIDLKEAEKILLDKLVKNVDTNKYFKDSEPKGKRFKLKTSKRDSAKFIVRRLRRK